MLATKYTYSVHDVRSKQTELDSVRTEIEKKEYQRDNNVCPYCESELKHDHMELNKQLVADIEELSNREQRLSAEYDSLVKQHDELKAEIKEAGLDPDKLEEKKRELEKKIEDFEKSATERVAKVKAEFEGLENEEDSDAESNE